MIVRSCACTSECGRSARGVAFLRFLGWIVAVILLGLVAMAGLGFYWMHKAKEAGLNPELIRKNRDLAAAELAVIRRGDVRVLSTNDAAGIMAVRDKRTGKTILLKFDPVKKSMAAITDEVKAPKASTDTNSATADKNIMDARDADARGSEIPSWVPLYPGVPPTMGSVDSNEKRAGKYSFRSSDAPEKIVSYYSDQLSSAGMKLSTASAAEGTTISAVQDSSSRTVVVTLSTASDGTHVTVSYEENKPPKASP